MSNEAARAARNEALRRHRKEVRAWKTLFIVSIAGFWLLLGGVVILYFRPKAEPPQVWRTGKGPALQPLYVVTQGFVDQKGDWRSYSSGEQIEITHWTPVQP
jgi:hypothetical protein